jgi:hypothetical protein
MAWDVINDDTERLMDSTLGGVSWSTDMRGRLTSAKQIDRRRFMICFVLFFFAFVFVREIGNVCMKKNNDG